jgi:hypothetical protein
MELNFSDLTAIVFLVIFVWMIIEMTGGGGGGHRARVPVPF